MILSSHFTLCSPAVVLTAYFTTVYALDPYYQSPQNFKRKPDFDLQKKVDESCDSPCYHNRISEVSHQPNITFLCGSDGFTYLNFDELKCVRSRCGIHIVVKQLGRCPRKMSLSSEYTTSSPPPPPLDFSSSQLQSKNPTSNLLDQNFLRFLSQQSSFPTPPRPLTFPEEEVRIPVNFESRPRKYWQPRRPLSRGHKKICLPAECNCPDDSIRPVCGSDSVTYGNECLLECSKECKPDLIKFHDGYCGGSYQMTATCPLNQCNCPEEEYDDDGLHLRQPTCGSDGITYGSVCLLECNKLCKPGLKLSYTGYCGKLMYPE